MVDISYARSYPEIMALRDIGKKVCPYIDVGYGKNVEGQTTATRVIKTLTPEKAHSIQHYPILKNWGRKIKPHLDNPELQAILAADFNKYTVGRWGKRFRLFAVAFGKSR